MAYKIKDNTLKILAQEQSNLPLALRFMANGVKSEAEPLTPKKSGMLRANVRINAGGKRASIRWGQKYAGAQEAGHMTVKRQRVVTPDGGVSFFTLRPGRYTFKNYTTPGTGAHFAERAVKKVARRHKRYFKMARLVS